MMEKIEKELRQRKNMLDKSFEWSEENIQKILAFNDAVLHKYKEAYDKVCLVKQDIETLSNSGKSVYDNYKDTEYDLLDDFMLWLKTNEGK